MEATKVSGNGQGAENVPAGSLANTGSVGAVSPGNQVQSVPPTPLAKSEPQKFQVELPEQAGASEEEKKSSAFSFLQKLVSREKGEKVPQADSMGIPASSNENAFTKLFGKTDGNGNGNGKRTSGSATASPLEKIMKQRPFLSRNPALDEFTEGKKLWRVKMLFWVVFFLALAFTGFIFFQKSPQFDFFGGTIAKKFEDTNKGILSLQTEINEARFRLVLFHLNRVNLFGDSFLFHRGIVTSSQSTSSEKLIAETRMSPQRREIKRSFQEIATILAKPFSLTRAEEEKFEQALTTVLNEKRAALSLEKPEDAEEIRTIDSLIQLISNRASRGILKNIHAESLDDAGLEAELKKIRERGADELSLIAQLKQKRIRWTEIMDRIDQLTRRVDKVYGQGLFDEIGGIRYTNYDFDTASGKVSLTGQVKTDDSKTFTLLANLIDAFEKSPYFKDLDMRDFTKSQGEKFGFTSSLRLQFSLQSPDEKDSRDSSGEAAFINKTSP